MNEFNNSTFNLDWSENVAYNNPLFPVYIREALLSYCSDYSFTSHWHDDFEFLYVMDGELTYSVNGELIDIKKGECIFVNSKQIHYGFSKNSKECKYVCILIHPSLLSSNEYFYNKYIGPFTLKNDLPYLLLSPNIEWQKNIIELLADMTEAEKDDYFEFYVYKYFSEVIHLLIEMTKSLSLGTTTNFSSINTLKSMVIFIHQNYKEKISLKNIANAGLCSKSKCSDLFNKYLKISPISYLTSYRLRIAGDLLRQTNKSVIDIAYECGFNSESYFCESFKKQYKLTPKSFRTGI